MSKKFKDILALHENLVERMGDDLVYSLTYDNGNYYLTISIHRSDKWKYKHGGQTQSALLNDFSDNIGVLTNKIVELYKDVLIPIDQEIEENFDETV